MKRTVSCGELLGYVLFPIRRKGVDMKNASPLDFDPKGIVNGTLDDEDYKPGEMPLIHQREDAFRECVARNTAQAAKCPTMGLWWGVFEVSRPMTVTADFVFPDLDSLSKSGIGEMEIMTKHTVAWCEPTNYDREYTGLQEPAQAKPKPSKGRKLATAK
jgi:hypothetical protein